MANRTVLIDCDEQGNYSVGEEPHESPGQEAAEQQPGAAGGGGEGEAGEAGIQMQPAKSIDDALKMARALLMAGEAPGDAGAAFQQGYQNTSGQAGPGGPPAAGSASM